MIKSTNSLDRVKYQELNLQNLDASLKSNSSGNLSTNLSNLQSLESQFHKPDQLVCKYHNYSGLMQVVRISSPSRMFLERTVLPDQQIEFLASHNALLEIYESSMFDCIHTDTIPCVNLSQLPD